MNWKTISNGVEKTTPNLRKQKASLPISESVVFLPQVIQFNSPRVYFNSAKFLSAFPFAPSLAARLMQTTGFNDSRGFSFPKVPASLLGTSSSFWQQRRAETRKKAKKGKEHGRWAGLSWAGIFKYGYSFPVFMHGLSILLGKDPTFLSISFQNRESQDSKKSPSTQNPGLNSLKVPQLPALLHLPAARLHMQTHSPFKRTPNLTRTPCSCTTNIVSAALNSYFTNIVYPYLHPLRDPVAFWHYFSIYLSHDQQPPHIPSIFPTLAYFLVSVLLLVLRLPYVDLISLLHTFESKTTRARTASALAYLHLHLHRHRYESPGSTKPGLLASQSLGPDYHCAASPCHPHAEGAAVCFSFTMPAPIFMLVRRHLPNGLVIIQLYTIQSDVPSKLPVQTMFWTMQTGGCTPESQSLRKLDCRRPSPFQTRRIALASALTRLIAYCVNTTILPGHFASSLENSWLLTWTKSSIPPFAALQRYNFFELCRCALKAGPSCLSAWLDQPNAFGHRSPCLSISSPPSVTLCSASWTINPGLDLAKTIGPPAISAIAVARLLPIQPILADGGWRPELAWPSLASNAQRRLFTPPFASSDRLLPNLPRDPDPANQTADASLLTPEHQSILSSWAGSPRPSLFQVLLVALLVLYP
ncbi:hypothetical protein CCUS01_10775 [Colletotrichum cuscutae]|uniref:Uncharacterized protein n=1 Tax=Colletotrichum cuscutae TaxID=1209917 RepID=A0AAI9U6R8_9PEZI|nr:hypothetical protein CCUS01_10775 [Colletotrichum cuscutae]